MLKKIGRILIVVGFVLFVFCAIGLVSTEMRIRALPQTTTPIRCGSGYEATSSGCQITDAELQKKTVETFKAYTKSTTDTINAIHALDKTVDDAKLQTSTPEQLKTAKSIARLEAYISAHPEKKVTDWFVICDSPEDADSPTYFAAATYDNNTRMKHDYRSDPGGDTQFWSGRGTSRYGTLDALLEDIELHKRPTYISEPDPVEHHNKKVCCLESIDSGRKAQDFLDDHLVTSEPKK